MRPLPSLLSCCLVLALLLPAGAVIGAGQGDQQADQQLKKLRQRIDDLQQQIHRNRGERDQLSEQLQEAEEKIGRLARQLRVLNGRIGRQHKNLAALRAQEMTQAKALKEQRELLGRQLRAAYATGREERIKLMLNQQDPATLSRVLTYYDYLNRARARRLESINRHLHELAQTRAKLAEEEAQLNEMVTRYDGEKQILERAQQARRSVLAALAAELSNQGSELKRLKNDEQRLQALLQGLQEALADIPERTPGLESFARSKGRLPWPASGRLSVTYGTPKAGQLRWDGVMISAPEGREVKAVHRGRVAFADWLRGFGLLMIIDHGDGYMSLYGHNQSLFKEAGDWVEQGETIGLVGRSGGQSRSGVYFGIRRKGKPINPARWCRRPKGQRVG